MRSLTTLERYGWERLAEMRLGITTGEARILAHMVLDANGRVVDKDALQRLLTGRKLQVAILQRLCKPLGRIRAALSDVGIRDAIEAHEGIGYSVYPEDIPEIRKFVEASG